MDSGLFHRTIAFLKANHYFGMPESQITITMQECIPAVKNMEGEIAVDENGHIIKKPHGHGEVHFCLCRVGHALLWTTSRTM